MTEKERAEHMLALRVTMADVDALDAVVAMSPGLLTRHAVARTAMRIGIEAIKREPSVLFSHPIPKRGGARPRKTRGSK